MCRAHAPIADLLAHSPFPLHAADDCGSTSGHDGLSSRDPHPMIELPNSSGWTPLMLTIIGNRGGSAAVVSARFRCTKLLINARASPVRRAREGQGSQRAANACLMYTKLHFTTQWDGPTRELLIVMRIVALCCIRLYAVVLARLRRLDTSPCRLCTQRRGLAALSSYCTVPRCCHERGGRHEQSRHNGCHWL